MTSGARLTEDIAGVDTDGVEATHDKASHEDGGKEGQPRRAQSDDQVADYTTYHHGLPPQPVSEGKQQAYTSQLNRFY